MPLILVFSKTQNFILTKSNKKQQDCSVSSLSVTHAFHFGMNTSWSLFLNSELIGFAIITETEWFIFLQFHFMELNLLSGVQIIRNPHHVSRHRNAAVRSPERITINHPIRNNWALAGPRFNRPWTGTFKYTNYHCAADSDAQSDKTYERSK